MNDLTARPELLKQANLSLIRRVIRARKTATRAEIARETNISSTTVRSLLGELLERGELESVGHDQSSGGRKAERYRFRPGRYHGAAFCISDAHIHALLVNVCGEVESVTELEFREEDVEAVICAYLDSLPEKETLRSIGLGVPGILDGSSYWRSKKGGDGTLFRIDLGDALARRYRLPVILENDLNATAIGFSRCYEKEYPLEDPERTDMVYLHLEHGCISAGLISGGRVLRGHRRFAGELGLCPMGGDKTLDDLFAQASDDKSYINLLIQTIGWLCGVLNPQYVILGGPNLRRHCVAPIGDGLSALLPGHMAPELLSSRDAWRDYHDGMAYLTAGRMFDDIQFIKEAPRI